MKITILLFCFLITATTACGVMKTASVDAGSESAANTAPQASADENGRAEKNFGENGENSDSQVRGSSLTGVYEFKGGSRANEIRVLQISDGVLKIAFLGNSEFASQTGPMANSGVISARKIQLEAGSRALLTNEEDAPDCMIFLTFKGNRLEARQKNDCGFPNGVSADGVYRKTSSEPPTFDFDKEPDDNAPDAIVERQTRDVQDDTAARIRFNAGERSSVVRGKITNGASVTYLIGARAGQTMAISVIDGGASSDVVFNVIAPDGERLSDRMYTDWTLKLPQNGDYIVQVSAIESANVNYKLRVTIR